MSVAVCRLSCRQAKRCFPSTRWTSVAAAAAAAADDDDDDDDDAIRTNAAVQYYWIYWMS